jgi:hypothetical protein
MAYSTGARDTASFVADFVHSWERLRNGGKVKDQMYGNNAMLYMSRRWFNFSDQVELPKYTNVPVNTTLGPDAEPYDHDDAFVNQTVDPPGEMQFKRWQYIVSVVFTDTEMLDHTTPEARVKLAAYRYAVTLNKFRQRLSRDLLRGNAHNPKATLGLEDVMYAADVASGTLGSNALLAWQYRRQTNTYGTITRSAWTSETAGGSGLEALTSNFVDAARGSTGETSIGFSSTAPYLPNAALREVNHLNLLATFGGMGPSLFLSSYKPFEDFANAHQGKYLVTPGADGGPITADSAIRMVSLGGKPWVADEFATSFSDNGDAAEPSSHNMYGLTPSTWHFEIDKRRNFSASQPVMSQNQEAWATRIRLRGLFYCDESRRNWRAFDIGT